MSEVRPSASYPPAMLTRDQALTAGAESRVPEQLAELNFFRLLLRRPRTAKAMSDLLVSLLAGSALSHRHRELAIMRIGWITGSEYEWTQHWRIAGQFGVAEADVLAARDWEGYEGFDASDRAVLRAVDEAVGKGVASPDRWAECTELLGEEAVIELAVAVGAWLMASVYLRAMRIPLEEGVASWPPDGTPPGSTGAEPGRK